MLPKIDSAVDEPTKIRGDELYHEHRQRIFTTIDRLFARLMGIQWIVAICLAIWISPKTWSGETSQTHIHVWAAVILGGIISIFPATLAILRPGSALTRYSIAVGQTLMSSLLIHLTGGRIETHFHVFGSLVILSFYRDWRVLLPATVLVALDHIVRGIYWPQSVYGVLVAEPWRWLEHAGWVLFEDVFLFMSCLRGQQEMRFIARRTAELETTNKIVEDKVVHISREISDRKEAELAMLQAKEEAERANGAKSEFLSRMSHELRTPMNAILGFAQLLELDNLTPDQHEGVAHILKGGRHLLLLINEVLDIARIESGRLSLSPEPVRVSEILQETLDLVRPLAAQRNVSLLEENISPHRYIFADRQRLKQVFLNLLSNAIKYNQAGGSVTLSCIARGLERGAQETGTEFINRRGKQPTPLRLIVTDTGKGIPSKDLGRLFSPFDRLGAEQTAVEGTGLGLALSKRLVEAMDGTMGVESTVGRGSVFWVELLEAEGPTDFQKRVGEASVADAQSSPAAMTILYVEDNLSNLKLVEQILSRRKGLKLISAMQGGLGIDLATEHKPDLILLDVNLPDMSGGDVLAVLKKNAKTALIPVVVISADAMMGQIERLMSAGAHSYLTKPIDVQKFLQVMDQLLKKPEGEIRKLGAQFPPMLAA